MVYTKKSQVALLSIRQLDESLVIDLLFVDFGADLMEIPTEELDSSPNSSVHIIAYIYGIRRLITKRAMKML